MSPNKGILHSYKDYLPVTSATPQLTLHEGGTPLIHLPSLSEAWGVNLYVKTEGVNPTGSFKDRGMVMAVAKAKEAGSKAIICASTGNTSASAAAYGSRAGLRTIVVIPEGKVALGKLAQASMYGAEAFEIEGNFDEALNMVREVSEKEDVTLVNSVNPYRMEGQKTGAFEICDVLGQAPDVLCIPVGNAGNITAYGKGFKEYDDARGTGQPRLFGFEADGAAAIARNEIVPQPDTLATAIRIGNPASWTGAIEAVEQAGGGFDAVSDEDIVASYRGLARTEGVFAEPASCASLAGLRKKLATGEIEQGSTVVCVLTGNGLKDPATALDTSDISPVRISNDIDVFRSQLHQEEGVGVRG
ncbi:threonine synthase [Natribacillus halophilus]|uniref:Threonine synthase n=1 Tax=Natribacillus halophilus TaxID=549003 RepID=A0A1G8RPQ6_9BACI|nr:threonine synthase [Natribacillus halophilus]SDJ18495.1 threonine synthase [Natribacillus halophilus]